jgi:Spy/CpxP family protein refolding chaperone
MLGKLIKATLLALVAVFFFAGTAYAADSTPATPPADGKDYRHHHPILFILNHAADLGLTDAQKSQLEALRDKIKQHEGKKDQGQEQGPSEKQRHWLHEQIEKILTADQIEKLKALRKQAEEANQKGK